MSVRYCKHCNTFNESGHECGPYPTPAAPEQCCPHGYADKVFCRQCFRDADKPAPREWFIDLRNAHDEHGGYVAWDGVHKSDQHKMVHVVEKSWYDEMRTKYNFMVDSAQQNARERNAAQAEVERERKLHSDNCLEWNEAIDKVEAERDAYKEYRDHIFDYAHKNLSGEYAGFHIADCLVREHRDLKDKCSLLEERLSAYQEKRLHADRDEWKAKCERLEGQINELETRVTLADEGFKTAIAERSWKEQAEHLAGALDVAKGQLEHAGYTKNAAPAAGKALAAFEKFKKENS